jgi:4-amino-4-deoxy-L-arabinose transferase-like glycosyltransferase
MALSAPPPQRSLWVLLLLLALVWFGNLEHRKLALTDEGRYAEIPREMVASGDWLTPRLNGLKYFEKPALQYWTTAAAYTLFGEHHWTARLWSALTGFLGILVTYFAGRRLFGPAAGLYGALVLASSLLYAAMGHVNTLDMGVTFFMGLGLMGFLLAQHPSASLRENRLWMHVTWAALALAVLSKGLIGVVLPGAVLAIYTLIQRDWALWKRLHLASGLALFLLIAAPWFIVVSLANPEFFRFFFIHEHFERFLTTVHRRDEPWWYFFPILLAGMLPWTVILFAALGRAWKPDFADGKAFQPGRFLLVWTVFIYLFFTLSGSKLPSYILPIFPALALLIGRYLGHAPARALFWMMVPMAAAAGAAFLLSPFAVMFADDPARTPLYQEYARWLAAAALVWLAGSLLGLHRLRRGQVGQGVTLFALGGLLAAQLALSGHDSLARSTSSYYIARQVAPFLTPDAPFYSVGMYDQSLPFYLKRTFTLVAHQDELAFGIRQEPDKWLPDFASFERAWRSQPYALAVMPPDTYRQLQQRGLPMVEIARDTRRVVVRTP